MYRASKEPSLWRRFGQWIHPGNQVDLVNGGTRGSELIQYLGMIAYLIAGDGQALRVMDGQRFRVDRMSWWA